MSIFYGRLIGGDDSRGNQVALDALAQLKLADKDGNIVELWPQEPGHVAKGLIRCQQRLWVAIGQQWAAGFPAMIVVLKARRLGISTFVDLWQYYCVSNLSNRNAFVCAHKAKNSHVLFDRVRKCHKLSDDRRPLLRSSEMQIAWDMPHGSTYTVETGGDPDLQRGALQHYIHVSEYSICPNQAATMDALMQCLPKQPGNSIIVESTAHGVGDEFHSLCLRARPYEDAVRTGDWSGFILVFFSWLDAPEEYSTPVPDGYDWLAVEPEVAEDEAKLRQLGATYEQLYWRREHIRDYCRGEVDTFRQEYPAWPEQAFLSSGRPAIPASITREHRMTVTEPRRAKLVWDRKAPNGVRAIFDEELLQPYWEIWQEPDEYRDYAIGGDVATGAVSDQSDETSDHDYSACMVLERGRIETAAQFVGRLPTDAFGQEMVMASRYYNNAWGSPEANAAGVAVVNVYKAERYENIYCREKPDQHLYGGESDLMGWVTTGGANGTRDGMIDAWISCCRAKAQEFGLTTTLLNHSERLVDEEERFVYDKQGKRQHRPGCHDDLLFAAMIALQMHIRCPRNAKTRPGEWRQPKTTFADAQYAGGRDLMAMMLDSGELGDRQNMMG